VRGLCSGTGKYKGITGSEPFACITMPALAGPGGYTAMDIPHKAACCFRHSSGKQVGWRAPTPTFTHPTDGLKRAAAKNVGRMSEMMGCGLCHGGKYLG
jgi:hypothetical protein